MHQVNALPVNARSARQNTIRYFIYSAADPSTSNTIRIKKLYLRQFLLPPSYRIFLESSNNEQVMLSTVVVFICGSDGSRRACRALLDCGSQANFVTKKFVEALGLETSIKPFDLRRQWYGNLDQSCGRNQITIMTQLVHHGYWMHRYWLYWSDYWQNSDVFFEAGQI